MWIYTAIQFLFIMFFTHLFYRYVSKTEHTLLTGPEVLNDLWCKCWCLGTVCLLQVHLQAVISIILATFAGFGMEMIGNSIVIEVLRWRTMAPAQPRRARRPRVAQQQPAPASGQPSGQPSAAGEGHRNTGSDIENPVIPQT
jgi:hypothetical protein